MTTEIDWTRTIIDFDNKEEADGWVAVSDNVMGGVSEGDALFSDEGCLVFSGTISLENNGGFASIRTRSNNFDLDGCRGIRIRVKGDGRIYQFRARVDDGFDGVAFKHDFQTAAGIWIEIDLPFESFQPTYRGKILQVVKPLNAGDIRQMGFLIADKAAGPFKLVVDAIKAYSKPGNGMDKIE